MPPSLLAREDAERAHGVLSRDRGHFPGNGTCQLNPAHISCEWCAGRQRHTTSIYASCKQHPLVKSGLIDRHEIFCVGHSEMTIEAVAFGRFRIRKLTKAERAF